MDWKDADVQCPFYRKVRRKEREIVCDPLVDGADVTALRFRTHKAFRGWLQTLCCDIIHYDSCPLYKALYAKYEAEE